ncbi:hypothetical protein FOZ61_010270 [Perkinsus olseni]|nr:hypothetical protein FOZ61_010270 [Perkinsus olseni]
MLLRQRLDVDLMNDDMSFEQFRDRVLLHHKQLTNYYGVDYETKDATKSSAPYYPKGQGRPNQFRPRDSSIESRGRRVSHTDYTPRSSTSPQRSRPQQARSVNFVDGDELYDDDYSIQHLLAI